MLEISAGLLAQIRAHAGESYPHECCGILLGSCESGLRKVRELRRAKNINTERSQDRYLMDPQDQLAAERYARAHELEVIGYYHSHPDHPAQASATDSAQSWENVSYLIVSVKNGSPAAEASFSRDASQNLLQPEEWTVTA